MAGINRFGGRNYYMSWQDSSAQVRNTKWDWFNARNYCRKRCMDLVSFETQQEYDWVKGFIDGELEKNKNIHLQLFFQGVFRTSGHLGGNAILEAATSQSSSPSW